MYAGQTRNMIWPLTIAPPSGLPATVLTSRWCGHNQASTTPGLDAGNVTPLWRPGGDLAECLLTRPGRGACFADAMDGGLGWALLMLRPGNETETGR